ncbi:hypothetical protein FPSE_05522 [Fusarium pseudograminearum CS3096]|uniref:Uncharacterized protein n=1 Tax=Fusarium pseudograminearum (strain CS3096) TaxID=1028729 RepID=K3W0I8_FUSPC|nr:hypothetical protein FPSE_05522 [Fusarium pseudograminearum CS3096]EKJ74225.1 hypothetical protein FPSE_05522 [Fusarium pseudograminearum CS3096]
MRIKCGCCAHGCRDNSQSGLGRIIKGERTTLNDLWDDVVAERMAMSSLYGKKIPGIQGWVDLDAAYINVCVVDVAACFHLG